MSDAFTIEYADEATADILALRAFDRRKVLDGIERHLTNQPTTVSHSRIKRMVQPFWSEFRLRVDGFRVYYDVDDVAHVVSILRVLEKTTGSTPQVPP